MLHVMPKREHEAREWSERAQMYWGETFSSPIESALGGLDVLKVRGHLADCLPSIYYPDYIKACNLSEDIWRDESYGLVGSVC
jgi:hypothetical protein